MRPSALAPACAMTAAHMPPASSPCAVHQVPVAGAWLDKDLLGKVDGRPALKACSRPFDNRYWIAILLGRLPAQQGNGARQCPLLAPTHMRTTRELFLGIKSLRVFAPPLCGRSTNLELNSICATVPPPL